MQLQASRSCGSTREVPVVRPGVQGGPELNGGEQLLKSESSPVWRSSVKIRRCRGLGRGRRARGASWGSGGSSARLRWRWSMVERRSRGGAEPCAAELGETGQSWVLAAVVRRGGEQGVRGGGHLRLGGDPGQACPRKVARGDHGGLAMAVATARLRWRRRGRQAGPASQRRREGRGRWAGWQVGPGCSGSGGKTRGAARG